ncbi:MAG: hypothetical protein AAB316_22095 [Bacteroidota bacterium]
MRNSTLLFRLLLLVWAATLTSCFSPRPVLRVEAEETEDIRWNYGRQVIRFKQDSLEAEIFFDRYTKEFLIFDVEVTNWRTGEVLVSPEDFYAEIGDGKIPAFDPEREIFQEEMDASRREANAKNATVAVAAAVVATAVAVAVASDGDGGGNNNNDDLDFGGFYYVSTTVPPPPPLAAYPPAPAFWEDLSLRKTTVRKGYKVGGKVVFPRFDHAREFSVSVPVGGTVMTAHFVQRVFKP